MKKDVYYHHISWQTVDDLTTHLALNIREYCAQQQLYDVLLSIGRGGLVPARILSEKLGIKKICIFDISSYTDDDQQGIIKSAPLLPNLKGKNVLAVDDCIFTGDTWNAVQQELNRHNVASANLAVLYTNFCNFKNQQKHFWSACDYNGEAEWLVFPWETGITNNKEG